ncbi:hypothetical protein [uncultured Bacteroides sp.]|uniref:hypothetical protein n=1 Tax=uncultured Bacteroides sp. TaxID=162156 RepID=UPI0025962772|nr:hypothetical protein [uncultured Bacteroides sp.]
MVCASFCSLCCPLEELQRLRRIPQVSVYSSCIIECFGQVFRVFPSAVVADYLPDEAVRGMCDVGFVLRLGAEQVVVHAGFFGFAADAVFQLL